MATKRAVDRRLQRTRTLLQDALKAMMIEKGYEATTVQDIIDRANVGRSTFYAHFADKETLLISGLEDLRDALHAQQAQAPAVRPPPGAPTPPHRAFAFSRIMLEHARDHAPLYSAIVGRKPGAIVLQRLTQMMVDLVREDLSRMGVRAASTQRDLIAHHVGGGFMGVLTWWMEHGAKLPPAEVDAIFSRLVLHGLGAELDRHAEPRPRR
jgi:AcrR family transcriptional regulator